MVCHKTMPAKSFYLIGFNATLGETTQELNMMVYVEKAYFQRATPILGLQRSMTA